MTDSTLNRYLSYGTAAQRAAFTPVPPTPASGPSPLYVWYETDTGLYYAYASAAWHLVGSTTGSTSRVLITETVTSASQSVVTFSSIPATYRDLEVRVRGRSLASGSGGANIILTLNNDTGSNYLNAGAFLTQSVGGYGTAGLVTGINAFGVPKASDTANRSGALQFTIYDYRGTTFQKPISWESGYSVSNSSSQSGNGAGGGEWASTSAVTRIDITCTSGFVDNSVVSLYGLM